MLNLIKNDFVLWAILFAAFWVVVGFIMGALLAYRDKQKPVPELKHYRPADWKLRVR